MSGEKNISEVISKEEFDEMMKLREEKSSIAKNCLNAFIVGGLICVLGEFVEKIAINQGLTAEKGALIASLTLMLLATIMTVTGHFSKLGRHAGAGTMIPITGFANSIVSPAIEFKKEGYITGVGTKIFTVAGPVIMYSVVTNCALGVVYYFLTYMK